MRRAVWLVPIVFLTLSMLHAGPVTPVTQLKKLLPSLASQVTLPLPCQGKLPVQAVGVGNRFGDREYSPSLGLYVFDGQGNAVAWEDDTGGRYGDRLAVQWVPPTDHVYFVELHNLSRTWNEVDLVVR